MRRLPLLLTAASLLLITGCAGVDQPTEVNISARAAGETAIKSFSDLTEAAVGLSRPELEQLAKRVQGTRIESVARLLYVSPPIEFGEDREALFMPGVTGSYFYISVSHDLESRSANADAEIWMAPTELAKFDGLVRHTIIKYSASIPEHFYDSSWRYTLIDGRLIEKVSDPPQEAQPKTGGGITR